MGTDFFVPLRNDIRVVRCVIDIHAIFIFEDKTFRLLRGDNDTGPGDGFLKVGVDWRTWDRLEPLQLSTGCDEETLDEIIQDSQGRNDDPKKWSADANLPKKFLIIKDTQNKVSLLQRARQKNNLEITYDYNRGQDTEYAIEPHSDVHG